MSFLRITSPHGHGPLTTAQVMQTVLLATLPIIFYLEADHPADPGVTVQQQLEESIGRRTTIGAVYAALDRLERKGYLCSCVGGATHERGGRRKRFFSVTESGVAALEAVRADREQMWSLVEGGR